MSIFQKKEVPSLIKGLEPDSPVVVSRNGLTVKLEIIHDQDSNAKVVAWEVMGADFRKHGKSPTRKAAFADLEEAYASKDRAQPQAEAPAVAPDPEDRRKASFEAALAAAITPASPPVAAVPAVAPVPETPAAVPVVEVVAVPAAVDPPVPVAAESKPKRKGRGKVVAISPGPDAPTPTVASVAVEQAPPPSPPAAVEIVPVVEAAPISNLQAVVEAFIASGTLAVADAMRIMEAAKADMEAIADTPDSGTVSAKFRGVHYIQGQTVCRVLCWMGLQGFTEAQGMAICNHYGLFEGPTPLLHSTVSINMRSGMRKAKGEETERDGRKGYATPTPEQAAELKRLAAELPAYVIPKGAPTRVTAVASHARVSAPPAISAVSSTAF